MVGVGLLFCIVLFCFVLFTFLFELCSFVLSSIRYSLSFFFFFNDFSELFYAEHVFLGLLFLQSGYGRGVVARGDSVVQLGHQL